MLSCKPMFMALACCALALVAAPAAAVPAPQPSTACTAANEGETITTHVLLKSYDWQCFGGQWNLVRICDSSGTRCQAA